MVHALRLRDHCPIHIQSLRVSLMWRDGKGMVEPPKDDSSQEDWGISV